MFWIHFKKVGAIISSEISLNARVIHKTISSSNGFFWWSVTVKAWIPSAIHCIQPFHYCRNTKCNKTEANLRGTRATVDWSSRFKANTAVASQSHDLQSVINEEASQATTSGLLNSKTHVRLSSEFLAFTIFDWSPKSEHFFFVWTLFFCGSFNEDG